MTAPKFNINLISNDGYLTVFARKIDPLKFNANFVLEFLVDLFDSGIGYSCINTARSALSAILCQNSGVTVGKSPFIKRFMKGVFQLRPTLPHYNFIWDVKIVLDYLELIFPLTEVLLEELTHK